VGHDRGASREGGVEVNDNDLQALRVAHPRPTPRLRDGRALRRPREAPMTPLWTIPRPPQSCPDAAPAVPSAHGP